MGGHLFRRKALKLPLADRTHHNIRAVFALVFVAALTGSTAILSAEALGGRRNVRLKLGQALISNALPVRQNHAGPALFTMALPDTPEITAWRRHYQQQPRALLMSLKRATRYRSLIWTRLRAADLPLELLFLPVLESDYRVEAVSRSGAVGLWQIMANTAQPLGLSMDAWVDERRDIVRSTEAALRKLEENYRTFGDWSLALAAYNGGTGLILRTLKRTGVRDFWELSRAGALPPETAAYVPKFYALAELCSAAGRSLGGAGRASSPAFLEDLWTAKNEHWRQIELNRPLDLHLLAAAAEVPVEMLQQGNRELKTNLTPPFSDYHRLKVKTPYYQRVQRTLDDPERELLRFGFHMVRSGDTLYALGRHYRVSVPLLREANPGIDPRALALGAALKIPIIGEIIPPPELSLPASFDGQYQVRTGDTLWALSRRFGTTPEALAAVNQRKLQDVLKPGEILRVPDDNH